MTCTDCTERRNAIIEDVLRFRLLSAAGQIIVGAAEMAGVKDKQSEKKAKAEAARNKVSQSPDYEDLGDLARKRFPKVRKALHADEAKATKGETE